MSMDIQKTTVEYWWSKIIMEQGLFQMEATQETHVELLQIKVQYCCRIWTGKNVLMSAIPSG